MKKIIGLLFIVLFCYEAYNIFIKTSHFNTDHASFEYQQNGLDALADTLIEKQIILDKPSFILLSKVLKYIKYNIFKMYVANILFPINML